MGIIDDYLSADKSTSEAVPTPKSSSLIDLYMNTADDKPAKVVIRTPKPPISGATKYQSDEINSLEGSKGGDNPRSQDSLLSNYGSNTAKDFVDAAGTFSKGLGDVLSNRSATGVGNVGLGVLQALASPITGAEKTIDYAIGKPEGTEGASTGERFGLIAGGLAPVSTGAKAAVATIPKNRAFKTLIESIGPENAGAVASAMKANPRLAPADLSPRVLQDTQHLFADDGPQINYLKNTSDARMASSKDVVKAVHGSDPSIDTVAKLKELSAAAKKAGSDKINPVVKSAGPVSVSDTLTALDNTLKPGILKIGDAEHLIDVKRQLESISKRLRASKEYDANDLHTFQSNLRERATQLLTSASGADRNMGEALMKVRNNLVNDIDKVTDGKYKQGLSAFRDEKNIAESYTKGYDDVFSNSKNMENRPEHTKEWFDSLTDYEKEAAKEGSRARMDTEIGVAKNGALAGESITRSDFNREKLEILLGKDEAARRIKALEDERAIANTHNKIVEGSQTAMRSASKDKFAKPTKSDVTGAMLPAAIAEGANAMVGGYPTLPTLALGGVKIGASAIDAVKMKLAREHNAQYAKYALPTEGPSRDELIRNLDAIANKPPRQSLLRRGANALTRVIAP